MTRLKNIAVNWLFLVLSPVIAPIFLIAGSFADGEGRGFLTGRLNIWKEFL